MKKVQNYLLGDKISNDLKEVTNYMIANGLTKMKDLRTSKKALKEVAGAVEFVEVTPEPIELIEAAGAFEINKKKK
tara:strand:+ start:119 stop:346 length:228 start_codon:yes stop_codon:yes gene_type:complete